MGFAGKRVLSLESRRAAEIAELKRRLAELEEKQSAKEKPEFKPDPNLSETLANYNPLDGVSMPGNAMKPMVDAVNPKAPKFDKDAWRRNSYPQPGGFGSPAGRVVVERGPTKVRPEEELPIPKQPWSGWSK